MFKYNFVEWLKAASIRGLKTFAQTMLSMLTVGAAMNEIEWGYIASCSLVALIASILTSVAGLPELDKE